MNKNGEVKIELKNKKLSEKPAGKKTIVFAGGGTAGHIVPFIALYPKLKKIGVRTVYIGSGKELETRLMQNNCDEILKINPPKLTRGFSITALKNLALPITLLKAREEAKILLKTIKPGVVFSKGGYCALPVCLAAFKLKIPVVCHESDLSIGLANKITIKKGARALCTFEKTARDVGGEYIGSPMREELFDKNKTAALKYFGIKNPKPVLLVSGGSSGSKTVNEAVFKNLPELLKRFNVIHALGKNNKCPYKPVNGYFAFEFVNMKNALAAADYCLSRGGSNTLFETLYAKKPCICVPLKKASRGDQIENARHFEQKGALIYCDEDELCVKLIPLLDKLREKEGEIIKNINVLNLKNGTQKLFEILCEYI